LFHCSRSLISWTVIVIVVYIFSLIFSEICRKYSIAGGS
jgi:amino acid transporter